MTASAETFTPLHKTVTVPWTQERAFTRFTREIGSWWPLRTHSVGGAQTERCGFEGRVGGQIYEETRSGIRHVWGTVLEWEPPARAVFTWHPDRTPDTAQNIEVRFTPVENGTRLDLIHTGWERLGAEGRKARRGYPMGWTYVLNHWAGRGTSLVNRLMDGMIWLMLRPTRVWQWLAGLSLLFNAAGAWVAYRRLELLHTGLHVVLALLSLWWVLWLWKRVRLKTSAPETAAQR